MNVNCRDNLWTERPPTKREEVWTTKTSSIQPRRDFDPQISTFHNNKRKPCQEQHTCNDVVASSSKHKLGENHPNQFHHGLTPQDDRRSCLRKVFPSPDGQKVWLVTDVRLPQGPVPKVIFTSL